ncbi:hypothetical protein RclHR1_10600005 [Rhizophagus clarus]|nr:hypothetical protein RclHR1_10600005 [Rhizophagus clarus]
MKKWEGHHNCYAKISEETGKVFTPKQIRQRWISFLDPTSKQILSSKVFLLWLDCSLIEVFFLVCHDELDENERSYIIKWVKENKNDNSSDKICWTKLISEIHDKFGKLRSENKVKNFYYLKKRQASRPSPKMKIKYLLNPKTQRKNQSRFIV